MQIKLTLNNTAEAEELIRLLYEHGMELEDDGHEDTPDALLLYKVAKQVQAQKGNK